MGELKFHNGPTVAINELLVPLLTGGVDEPAEYWIRKLGIVPVEDWFGRRALKVEDARRVVQTYRAATAEHSAKWDRYHAWQQAERVRRAKERAERFAAERAEAQRIKDAKRQQWILEEIQSREAALAAVEEAKGPSFEDWSQSHDGGASVPSDGMRSSVTILTDVRS